MNTEPKKPNPYLSANCLSKLSFWWILDIFRLGKSGNLRPEDLYSVLPESVSESLGDQLEKLWENKLTGAQMKKRNPSLHRVISKTFGWPIMKHTFGVLTSNLLNIAQPVILAKLLQYVQRGHTMSSEEAYIYASALVLAIILQMMSMRHVILSQYIVLKLSSTSANPTANGYIINILSNDLAKLARWVMYGPFLWIMPFLTFVILYLTWQQLGDAAIVGILLMVIQVIPPQVILYKVAEKLRADYAASTDKRVMLIGEVISGIKVIKVYAWENYFEKLVHLAERTAF